MRFTPLTKKRLAVFKRNALARFSLWALGLTLAASLGAEFIANDRPYVMRYQGTTYFPIVSPITAQTLGITGQFTIDYDKLDLTGENWAVFPPVRFNPYMSNTAITRYPGPPTLQNPLGTDDRGRDVFTRLLYGFRISFLYAVGVWIITFMVGITLGLIQGYFGGRVDFAGQRITEVLSSVPQFFLLIILISIFSPNIWLLIGITSVFGWISISYYMRAEALKLRNLEFVEAARGAGQPTYKILIKHVLPNALTPLITFTPFTIAAGITGLAALDYLGFGLTPPTPSWGELLNQAKKYFTYAWWLALYPSLALFTTLTLLNFVGEGLRNAFDPKQT
jgi:microcin C transport system permease protein